MAEQPDQCAGPGLQLAGRACTKVTNRGIHRQSAGRELSRLAAQIARLEGLDAHAAAAEMRLSSISFKEGGQGGRL